MKVYMLRHQKAGILTAYVFSKLPTPSQVAPLKAECERLHGADGWMMVHQAELLDDEVPVIASPSGSMESNVTINAPTVSGKGTVTSKESP